MDGQGRVYDSIFWRTFKYEEVYLKDYGNVDAARRSLCCYWLFYN